MKTAYEANKISASIKPMVPGPKQNSGTTELLGPVSHSAIRFSCVCDDVIFDHNYAKIDTLLADKGKLHHGFKSLGWRWSTGTSDG